MSAEKSTFVYDLETDAAITLLILRTQYEFNYIYSINSGSDFFNLLTFSKVSGMYNIPAIKPLIIRLLIRTIENSAGERLYYSNYNTTSTIKRLIQRQRDRSMYYENTIKRNLKRHIEDVMEQKRPIFEVSGQGNNIVAKSTNITSIAEVSSWLLLNCLTTQEKIILIKIIEIVAKNTEEYEVNGNSNRDIRSSLGMFYPFIAIEPFSKPENIRLALYTFLAAVPYHKQLVACNPLLDEINECKRRPVDVNNKIYQLLYRGIKEGRGEIGRSKITGSLGKASSPVGMEYEDYIRRTRSHIKTLDKRIGYHSVFNDRMLITNSDLNVLNEMRLASSKETKQTTKT